MGRLVFILTVLALVALALLLALHFGKRGMEVEAGLVAPEVVYDVPGPYIPTTTAPPTTTASRPVARTAPIRVASVSRPVPSGDVWHALAMCETGGTMNQRATSRTGRYLGYFQFSLQTWRSVGGPGDPRDHPYEVQKAYAVTLQHRSGWNQWPTCARRLGLI